MRRIKDADFALILQNVEEARSFIRYGVYPEIESAVKRLNQLENMVRIALGEKPARHVCYHMCEDGHADLVKR